MPRFRLHLEWDDEFRSRDQAKELLRDIWTEVEQLTSEGSTLEVFDVAAHPAKGGGTTRTPFSFGVIHPWDEGMSIFPPDHPFRVYEDEAREGERTPEQREAWLEAGQKMLGAPSEPDPRQEP